MTEEKKPAVRRTYIVTDHANGKKRLVRAVSPSAAVMHVFEPTVALASQDELVALVSGGAKVEEA